MRWTLMFAGLAVGCAPLATARMGLVDQARSGLAKVGAARVERTALVEELSKLRHDRLDEAFDADVRDRGSLSADWVIEHRRAYGAGLAALAESDAASRAADAATESNLSAIDAALGRIKWLDEMESRYSVPWMDLGQ